MRMECGFPAAPLPKSVQNLATIFPDGSCVRTAAPGCILDRAVFDGHLAGAPGEPG
jgi:hypothetical protein